MEWYINADINDGYPYNPDLNISPEAVYPPYPAKCFRLDSDINGGYPYLNFLYVISYREPVKQTDKIILYNMDETDFTHFGVRILTPLSCRITEELNGQYELEMEHPVDNDGTWAMIDELDIIKAKGQLFRIYRTVRKMNSDGSRTVQVNARHIFYDLNDRLLTDVRPTECNGQQALDWIMNNTFRASNDIFNEYAFSAKSDIETVNTAYYQNMSPAEAMLGADNCFLNRWGGELYRDNFYFSLNSRREKSLDNAFDILYSVNMFEIEETIDYSDFCSYMIAHDNYGNSFAKSYAFLEGSIPHNFYRSINFNYDEYNFEAFKRDASLYFDTICTPSVNYRVTFADLRDMELYKDFAELQRCEVGDRGIIRNEKLNIFTEQMIVRKVYDAVNDRVESVELGNIKNSLTRNGSYSNIVSDGNSLADKQQKEIHNLKVRTFSSHSALAAYSHNELQEFTYKELGGEL